MGDPLGFQITSEQEISQDILQLGYYYVLLQLIDTKASEISWQFVLSKIMTFGRYVRACWPNRQDLDYSKNSRNQRRPQISYAHHYHEI